jgi:small subunit ribosomal protein S17e
MGRIKSKLVKRTGRELLSEKNAFNHDFENNKKVLKIIEMPSKKIRNQLAGYIVRIRKKETKKK